MFISIEAAFDQFEDYPHMSEESLKEMEEIYRKYCMPLKKYVISLCHNADTADDIVSETFYRAILNIDTFEGSNLFGWLCTIAKNLYFNQLKKKDNNNASLDDEDFIQVASSSDVEEDVIKNAQHQRLMECISDLSETERQVVTLRISADLTFSEIGRVLNKTENWARVTFYRCKEKLKGMMIYE